jgi:hypothetical protein
MNSRRNFVPSEINDEHRINGYSEIRRSKRNGDECFLIVSQAGGNHFSG